MTNKSAYEAGFRYRIEHFGFQGVRCSPSFAKTKADVKAIKKNGRSIRVSSTVFELQQDGGLRFPVISKGHS